MLRLSRLANIQHSLAVLVLTLLTACGGGGSSTNNPNLGNNNPSAQVASYTLGGLVNGLTGSGLILSNGSQTVNIDSGASNFAFATAIASGQDYSVSIQTQPLGQTCSISNSTGKILNTNITDVTVTCATNAHALGGTITGLTENGLVLSNGSDQITLNQSSNAFAFHSAVAEGGNYTAKIVRQPQNLSCKIEPGTANGNMGQETISNIKVSCTPAIFHNISGTFTGAPSSAGLILGFSQGISLHNNTYSIGTLVPANNTTSGTFEIKTAIAEGEEYVLNVYPKNDFTCTVQNAKGIMGTNDVTNVNVICSVNSYVVSGNISGLTSDGLILTNSSGDQISIPSNATQFSFNRIFAENSYSNLEVKQQPTNQYCTIINPQVSNINHDVNDINITCQEAHNLIADLSGVTLNGLYASVSSTSINNGIYPPRGSTTAVIGKVIVGESYSVSLNTQKYLSCAATSGSTGTMAHNDIHVIIQCQGKIQQSNKIKEINNDSRVGYTRTTHYGSFDYPDREETVVLLDDGNLNIYRTKIDLQISGHGGFIDVVSTPHELVLNNFTNNIKALGDNRFNAGSVITNSGVVNNIDDLTLSPTSIPVTAAKMIERGNPFVLDTSGIVYGNYTTCTFATPNNCLQNITDIAIVDSHMFGNSSGQYGIEKRVSYFAISNDGHLYAWGSGMGILGSGQLDSSGYVSEADQANPTLVPGLTNIGQITSFEDIENSAVKTSLTSYDMYIFAMRKDGTVMTWSTKSNFQTPHVITALSNVKEVSGRVALLQNGSIVPDMRDLSKTLTGLPPIKHLSNEYLIDFSGKVYITVLDTVSNSYYFAEVSHP